MKNIGLIGLLFCGLVVSGQNLKALFDSSIQAYEKKDYLTYLTLTKTLDSLRPSHPKFTYNLASALALNNQNEAALLQLEKNILMNNSLNFEEDDDFKVIQNSLQYLKLLELKKSLNDSVSNAVKKLILSEKEIHPEGLVFLKNQNFGLATSIRKRKIVSFDIQTGKCSDWLCEKNMLAVFSIKVDSKGEFLWVATAAIPEMENYTKALEGKAEILKVAIHSRKIVKRYSIDGFHVFGDLVVTKNDVVYISDSNKPRLYKIENESLTEWLNLEKEAFNLQGITLNDSEDKLFIADYLKGILTISLKDKSNKWMQFPQGTTQKGIDGLTYYNNSLIAIHNGVSPIRIIQYFLNIDQNHLDSFKILDHNRAQFKEPVLGTIKENSFYFIGNSPWSAYSKSFELDPLLYTNPILFVNKL